jgi:hypothetical protein
MLVPVRPSEHRPCAWCGDPLPHSARVLQKYHRPCQFKLQRVLMRNYYYVRGSRLPPRFINRAFLCKENQNVRNRSLPHTNPGPAD